VTGGGRWIASKDVVTCVSLTPLALSAQSRLSVETRRLTLRCRGRYRCSDTRNGSGLGPHGNTPPAMAHAGHASRVSAQWRLPPGSAAEIKAVSRHGNALPILEA